MSNITKELLTEKLREFIESRPGLDWRNYYSNWTDKDGIAAFRSDKRKIETHRNDALALLGIAACHIQALGAIMTNNTRVTYMRVQGAGWSVFVISGTGHNRAMRRAPGFENIDNYTMAQAQVAADNLRRDIAQGLEVKQP